ncbi:hypothetical protein COOONC_12173 [Cooperia oncophora]
MAPTTWETLQVNSNPHKSLPNEREFSFARTVLWIDASYKAEDFKLNVSALPECKAWQKYWAINATTVDEKSTNTTAEETLALESELKEVELIDNKKRLKKLGLNVELLQAFKEVELIDNKKRLKKLGLNVELLQAFKAVGLLYKEICREHERVLWYRDTADAKKIGITESSLICEPFKVNSTDITLS